MQSTNTKLPQTGHFGYYGLDLFVRNGIGSNQLGIESILGNDYRTSRQTAEDTTRKSRPIGY